MFFSGSHCLMHALVADDTLPPVKYQHFALHYYQWYLMLLRYHKYIINCTCFRFSHGISPKVDDEDSTIRFPKVIIPVRTWITIFMHYLYVYTHRSHQRVLYTLLLLFYYSHCTVCLINKCYQTKLSQTKGSVPLIRVDEQSFKNMLLSLKEGTFISDYNLALCLLWITSEYSEACCKPCRTSTLNPRTSEHSRVGLLLKCSDRISQNSDPANLSVIEIL